VGSTSNSSAAVDIAATPAAARHDLSELLEQLHDDMNLGEFEDPVAANAPLTDPRDLERPKLAPAAVFESGAGLAFRPAFASFAARFVGAAVDGIALTIAMLPGFYVALSGSGATPILGGVGIMIVGFVLMTAWYARSVASSGKWLGNRVAGSRVVDGINGSNIDASRAAARFVIRHLVSAIFLFGFLAALGDGQRRTFHDRVASTVVVGRTRATWSADDPD
jgi:uncharacterized RDD family membrane protein YckC